MIPSFRNGFDSIKKLYKKELRSKFVLYAVRGNVRHTTQMHFSCLSMFVGVYGRTWVYN